MPSLFVFQGPDQGALFEIDTGWFRIGRDATNAFQLHDDRISPEHAELHYDGATCMVFDLTSASGVSVNGNRMVAPASLRSNDQVQMGDTIMLYTDPTEPSPDCMVDWVQPWIERFHKDE